MKHKHHTQTSGRTPENIQAANNAAREQIMTPSTPDQFVRPGTIAPTLDHWGTQQPTPALGSGTL